jgi:hypothetical protein
MAYSTRVSFREVRGSNREVNARLKSRATTVTKHLARRRKEGTRTRR